MVIVSFVYDLMDILSARWINLDTKCFFCHRSKVFPTSSAQMKHQFKPDLKKQQQMLCKKIISHARIIKIKWMKLITSVIDFRTSPKANGQWKLVLASNVLQYFSLKQCKNLNFGLFGPVNSKALFHRGPGSHCSGLIYAPDHPKG